METPTQPTNTSVQSNQMPPVDTAEPIANRMAEICRRLIEVPGADERAAAFEADQIEQRRRARRDRLIVSAGQAYRDKTLANFHATLPVQHAVVETLRDYVENLETQIGDGRGIVLFGPCGTGKDHLLFGVARNVVEAGYGVTWVNGQDWFGDIRDDMDGGGPERQRISRLASSPVLIISDPLPPIGALGQHMATMLYRLLDDRMVNGLPTLVSVNVANEADATKKMGVGTWQRMLDNAWVLECDWPVYRAPFCRVGGKTK